MDLHSLYWWNDNLALLCSLLMNSTVVYFVLIERAKALRSYSKMILLNCFIELSLACVVLALRPRIILDSSTFIVVITNSVWQHLNDQRWLNLLSCLLAMSGAVDCIKLMVEFLYRYLLVCCQYELSLTRLILIAIGIYLCALINVFLYFLSLSPQPMTEWRDVLMRSEFFGEEGVKFVVADTRSFGGLSLAALGFSTAIFTYTVIIVCSRRILLTLRSQQAFMSLKTLKMHQGLNMMLFAQACAPLATSVIPVTIVLGSILLGHGSELLGHVVSFTLPWISVPGPLCTLICVPSYRRRIGAMLLGRFRPQFKVSATHAMSTTIRQ